MHLIVQNIRLFHVLCLYACVFSKTHIHGGVDLCDSFILCGELINLHSVTNQLAHDLDL